MTSLDLRTLVMPNTYVPELDLAPGQQPVDVMDVVWRAVMAAEGPLADTLLVKAVESVGVSITHLLPVEVDIQPAGPAQLLAAQASTDDGEGVRYAWNGGRKLEGLAMLDWDDTLSVALSSPGDFTDVVLSAEPDGRILWGVFPHGGAVLVRDQKYQLGVGVSTFSQIQDHALAYLAGWLALERVAVAEGRAKETVAQRIG